MPDRIIWHCLYKGNCARDNSLLTHIFHLCVFSGCSYRARASRTRKADKTHLRQRAFLCDCALSRRGSSLQGGRPWFSNSLAAAKNRDCGTKGCEPPDRPTNRPPARRPTAIPPRCATHVLRTATALFRTARRLVQRLAAATRTAMHGRASFLDARPAAWARLRNAHALRGAVEKTATWTRRSAGGRHVRQTSCAQASRLCLRHMTQQIDAVASLLYSDGSGNCLDVEVLAAQASRLSGLKSVIPTTFRTTCAIWAQFETRASGKMGTM